MNTLYKYKYKQDNTIPPYQQETNAHAREAAAKSAEEEFLGEVCELWHSNTGELPGVLPRIIRGYLREGFEPALVKCAIEACGNARDPLRYLQGILRNRKSEGCYTLLSYEAMAGKDKTGAVGSNSYPPSYDLDEIERSWAAQVIVNKGVG